MDEFWRRSKAWRDQEARRAADRAVAELAEFDRQCREAAVIAAARASVWESAGPVDDEEAALRALAKEIE